MSLAREIPSLIRKEILLEWRQKYALNGLLLYAGSTIFVCYLSFALKQVPDITWNTLLWIILLFTSINAIAKSFMQERQGRWLYYYSLVSAQGIILSKIIYNSLLMIVLTGLSFGFYSFVMLNPVDDLPLFLAALLLGAVGFANTFTMMAAIASKANNSATLMSVLSFPVIIPMLVVLVRLSKNAMDGLDRSVSSNELIILGGINLMVIGLSYILFPYLWRS